MSISADIVRQLRERSGAGMMDCKKALVEAGGDMEKAKYYHDFAGDAEKWKNYSRKP